MGDTQVEKTMLMFPQERKCVRVCHIVSVSYRKMKCTPKSLWRLFDAVSIRGNVSVFPLIWRMADSRIPSWDSRTEACLFKARCISSRWIAYRSLSLCPSAPYCAFRHLSCIQRNRRINIPCALYVYPLTLWHMLSPNSHQLQHVGVTANVVDVKTGKEQTTNEFRFTWCKDTHADERWIQRRVVPKTYKGKRIIQSICPST